MLPPAVTARVAFEEGSPQGWERYAGNRGEIMAMRTFGQSAPFKDVEAEFGFTADNVARVARETLERNAQPSTT